MRWRLSRAWFALRHTRGPLQDSMIVIDQYGKPKQMFIAVFDGHGPNGALASQFVRSVLPKVCVLVALSMMVARGWCVCVCVLT